MTALSSKTRIKPTHENLSQYAVKPMIRLLISAALNRSTITYGEAKRHLEDEHGFSTIFSAEMGHLAGMAMERLQSSEDDVPLLNVLAVNQETGLPGEGAGGFLADRFGIRKLGRPDAPKKYAKDWRRYCEQAADEVYAFNEWQDVYDRLFDEPLTRDTPQTKGREKDGISYGRGGGEGPHHKALRLWVQANPESVFPRLTVDRSETEFCLMSGDRIDVVYFSAGKTIAIEVKSKDSNWDDLHRGIYQCVKYRAVLAAQDGRGAPDIETLLVTEEKLDGALKALAKRLGVRHAVHSVN